jgi:hypothetical protein
MTPREKQMERCHCGLSAPESSFPTVRTALRL